MAANQGPLLAPPAAPGPCRGERLVCPLPPWSLQGFIQNNPRRGRETPPPVLVQAMRHLFPHVALAMIFWIAGPMAGSFILVIKLAGLDMAP